MFVKPIEETPELSEALRKTSTRLLPFLALLYLLAFLDRVNVSFAALSMNADLGLSPFVYGTGAGIFFLGYVLLEVPSNLILHRVGARVWIARIMVSWGLVSAATAFVSGPTSFLVARFLLGAMEAGFFPGIILYLTYWYPPAVRGKIVGTFMLAIPLSAVVGAPLSGSLLNVSVLGLKGWQSLFLIEGLPSVLVGVLTFYYLPDRPKDARWLTGPEQAAIEEVLGRQTVAEKAESSLGAALRSPRLWLCASIYFCIVLALYGLNFWTPLLVRSLSGLSNIQVGWLTALPNLIAALAMYWWGAWSDSRNLRVPFIVAPCLIAVAGFVVALALQSAAAAIVAIYLATICVYVCLPVFWTIPANMLTGVAAAGGIAIVNSVGNVSGYLGPFLLGALQQSTGNHLGSFACLAASLLAAAILCIGLKGPGRATTILPTRSA